MTNDIFTQTGRIEVHPIHTLTLSDRQFLSGAKDGVPALIAGELRFPAGNGPFPAVVLVHGSGGVGSNVNRWAAELNKIGIAAFIIDCFTGRGITSTIPDQSRLGSLAMIYDAYKSLGLLCEHSGIDSSRIGVMGFSKGGFVAMYASMRRFQAFYAPPGTEFAVYFAFYARCDIAFDMDEDVSDRPIRMFHGEEDDWVPVEPVRRYVARLQAAGKDIFLTSYPGARHAFDSPTYPPMFTFADAEISNQCRLAERDGEIINRETGKPFTRRDTCITRGATVGASPEAYEQARLSVRAVLSEVFRLATLSSGHT